MEKGTDKNYGLSEEERERQFSKKRDKSYPNYTRFEELDMKKADCAISMMKRAWKAGLRAAYALCDSWFTCEEFIHAIRSIGDGSVHFLGMGKMGNKRYYVRGFHQNVYEIISQYERTETKKMPKYNSRYFMVNSLMGKEIFRIFFIKFGHNQNWNIIITTDMTMNSRDETASSRAIKEELAVLRFSQGSRTGSHVLFSRLLLQTLRSELLRIHQYVFVETLTKDTNDVFRGRGGCCHAHSLVLTMQGA